MWDRKDIKARGKAAFKANFWACVIVAIILGIASGAGSASQATNRTDHEEPVSSNVTIVMGGAGIVGLAVQILALNPLAAGCRRFYIENSRENGEKPGVGEVLYFFKEGRWGNAVKVMFVYKLVIVLWTLLFIVPGIVKGYSYRLVPYLLCENPDISPREALDRSRDLMNGRKSAVFAFDLSFIGWFLLGIVTLGILLVFHVAPWFYSADGLLCRTIGEEE